MKKIFLSLFLIINVNSVYASDNNIVKLLSTTSTRDSGLYGYLLPIFENEFNNQKITYEDYLNIINP